MVKWANLFKFLMKTERFYLNFARFRGFFLIGHEFLAAGLFFCIPNRIQFEIKKKDLFIFNVILLN